MAEIQLQLREQKVLKALSGITEAVRASDIEGITGEIAPNIANSFKKLAEIELVELVDKRKKLWQITENGTKIAASIQLPATTLAPAPATTPAPATVTTPATLIIRTDSTIPQPTQVEPPPEQAQELIVPSQAVILRDIGERLGISVGTPKKGEGATLDAIIYYVERTADMNNLTQVWNSITSMGIPNHIIKRWITLYAQTLEHKEIPEELKEKLENIAEKDKVASTEKGEAPPKPKRFILIGNEIIGDPEGDLNYNQALQQRAQNLGAAPAEANTAATIIEALKVGPEMSTSLLTVLLPLLTKEPPKHDDSALLQFITAQQTGSQNQMQMLQQMIMTATEEKHKAEFEGLKVMITTGQKPPETEALRDTFTKQIDGLKDALHQQQLDNEKREREIMKEQFQEQMRRMEQQILASSQSKQIDSKFGIMHDMMQGILGEAKGVRTDVKPLVEGLIARGQPPPPPRTAEQKQAFKRGLDRGIQRAQEATRLEDKLFFSAGPPTEG